MGLEIILGAAALAVGLVSTGVSVNAANQSAAAQKEAQNITLGQSKVRAQEDRRQLLREERIRRARILQSSNNAGVSNSSGEIGAMGAITTNVDSQVASARGESLANTGINKQNQKAMDFDNKAKQALQWGEVFQGGINTFANIFDQ
jgi:hypothetical protein